MVGVFGSIHDDHLLGGLYRFAKSAWHRHSSFDNMKLFVQYFVRWNRLLAAVSVHRSAFCGGECWQSRRSSQSSAQTISRMASSAVVGYSSWCQVETARCWYTAFLYHYKLTPIPQSPLPSRPHSWLPSLLTSPYVAACWQVISLCRYLSCQLVKSSHCRVVLTNRDGIPAAFSLSRSRCWEFPNFGISGLKINPLSNWLKLIIIIITSVSPIVLRMAFSLIRSVLVRLLSFICYNHSHSVSHY